MHRFAAGIVALAFAFALAVALPSRPAHAEPPEVRSRGAAVTGGFLAGAGAFGLLVATPFAVSSAGCEGACGHSVAVWPFLAASGTLVAVGVPLLVFGYGEPAPRGEARPGAPRPAIAITPGAPADGPGMTTTVTF